MSLKKKNDSLFLAPYNLVRLLYESVMLMVTFVKLAIFKSKEELDKDDVTPESKSSGAAEFLKFTKELESEDFKSAWKRYLYTGLTIQTFFFLSMSLNALLGNYIIATELSLFFMVSVLFFGYKPWMIRNKQYVSVFQYLKKLPNDLGSLLLWKNINLRD